MFTVLGEALLDMVQPEPGDTYRALPAGGPLNIAVGLRRLGHPTSMMARFSSGALGTRIRRYAEASDLDLSGSVTTDEQATLAFATVDGHGRASYDFFVHDTADWGWTFEELDRLPAGTRVLHTGSLATVLEPGAGRIAVWWERHSRAGDVLLSFDPNVRPALAGPRSNAVAHVERMVASSHVVKASDEDVGWLYPHQGHLAVLQRWVGLGPALAVLTRGDQGCAAVTSSGLELEIAAPQVELVDTIGAGDAFQSGLLSGLAHAGMLSRAAVSGLTEETLTELLERALDVAALTCRRAGADPPTSREYDAFAGRRVAG